MSMMVSELYDALRQAGVEESVAKAAAQAVLGSETRSQMATKADIADAKADIIKWTVGISAVLLEIAEHVARLLDRDDGHGKA